MDGDAASAADGEDAGAGRSEHTREMAAQLDRRVG
jgi:hypothetical protein